ncbi:MAG: hypothetical protein EOP49_44665 [Sphingobacteriales bacterium]|nr:MAG: hypothetical protein EOP49_44665 [Sphingobacteriales bacterium]
MSQIAIVVKGTEADAAALLKIKAVTGQSVQDIKTAIQEQKPVYTGVLFFNDHDEVAEKLKSLLDSLDKNGLGYSIYELEEGEDFANVAGQEQAYAITKETLLNILQTFDRERERQENL